MAEKLHTKSWVETGESDSDGVWTDGAEWTRVSYRRPSNRRANKRQRASTDETSLSGMAADGEQDFTSLSTDRKLELILKNQAKHDKSMASLSSQIDHTIRLTKRIPEIEQSVRGLSDRMSSLNYRSIDAEARSRRNNLLFKGFPEERSENCERKIRDFISIKLGIHEVIQIERVNRIGPHRNGVTRHIIVAFSFHAVTERILASGYKLKGCPQGVSRDFPLEIEKARQQLWPTYKELRDRYPEDRVRIVYPAKLIRNGRVVCDLFPDWSEAMRQSRVSTARFSEEIRQCRDRLGLASSERVFGARTSRDTSSHVLVSSLRGASDGPASTRVGITSAARPGGTDAPHRRVPSPGASRRDTKLPRRPGREDPATRETGAASNPSTQHQSDPVADPASQTLVIGGGVRQQPGSSAVLADTQPPGVSGDLACDAGLATETDSVR